MCKRFLVLLSSGSDHSRAIQFNNWTWLRLHRWQIPSGFALAACAHKAHTKHMKPVYMWRWEGNQQLILACVVRWFCWIHLLYVYLLICFVAAASDRTAESMNSARSLVVESMYKIKWSLCLKRYKRFNIACVCSCVYRCWCRCFYIHTALHTTYTILLFQESQVAVQAYRIICSVEK